MKIMKITGNKSLLWWIRYPFGIYTAGFGAASLWILGLLALYFFTGETNRFISSGAMENPADRNIQHAVQFHYPFGSMVLNTENSTKGILLAFLGVVSINFILIAVFRIILELSRDNFFTGKAVRNCKILGFGLLSFGIIHTLINLLISPQQPDLAGPFIFIVTGFIFILLKEIFLKGKNMQDESDLVI